MFAHFLKVCRQVFGPLIALASGLAFVASAQGQIRFDQPIQTSAIELTNQIGILVVVNDHPITDVDLAYRINLDLATSDQPNTNENRRAIAASSLDALIFDRIKITEGERRGIRVSPEDLRRGLADIAGNNRQTPTVFLQELAQQGVPAQTFYDLIEAQFIWQSLTRSAIAQQANVSETDISAEVARINSLRGRRERLISEIFLPYAQFGSQVQTVSAAINLIAQLKSGTSFGDLAQQFSYAPTAALGGRMGWVAEGTLAPEIEQRLATMFAGQISEPPIQARDGVYIMGIQQSRPIGASESQTLVRLLQLFRNIPPDQQSYDAQQDFVILNAATVEAKNCADFSTYINTYGDDGSGDMGNIDLAKLPPGISQLLATLPDGEPSAVVPVPNGGAVFMVCERQENIDPITREQIENRLIAERSQILTKRYERDLRGSAQIDYRF